MTIISSRLFNQDTSGAKKSALQGPVFITDRGKTVHVLLSISDYEALQSANRSLLSALAQTDEGDFDFQPTRLPDAISQMTDLS